MAETRRRRPRRLIILATFLVAYLLVLVPAPGWAAIWRPPWVALVLIYWCMALPHLVGIGTAFGTGLAADVLQAGPFGQQALANTAVAWLVLLAYRRLRVYSPAHQAIYVLGLLLVHRAVLYLVLGGSGRPPAAATFWLPSLSGALLWPWVLLLLRELRRSTQAR